MNPLRALLSTSPKAKIYRLITAAWLLFLLGGFAFFNALNINQRLEGISAYAELVLAVNAPFVAEAAEGSRQDLIEQALATTARSPFIDELAITSLSGEVRWQSHVAPSELTAPRLLNTWFKSKLPDIQKPLLQKGQTIGALKLSFETEPLANDAWHLFWLSFIFTALLSIFGVLAGVIPLSQALKKVAALGQQAQVTLSAIKDGVISCTAHFELLSINPGAQHLLGLSAADVPGLLGQDVRILLPNLFMDNEVGSNWVARDYTFASKDGVPLLLETGLVDVEATDPQAVGKVLILRDVSQAQALASAQHAELQEHKNALASMKKVLDSLSQSTQTNAVEPAASLSGELNFMTNLVIKAVSEREISRLELEQQKFSMDQHAMVLISDSNGLVSYANDRYCALSGFNRGVLLGQRPNCFNFSSMGDDLFAEMLDATSNGKVWRGILKSQNAQGHTFWINATVVPLLNAYLVIDRSMLIGTDITQEQESKLALTEQLSLMEVLLEAIPLAIYFKDSLGRYCMINTAFEKLFGLSREDLIGKTARDIVSLEFATFAIEKDHSLQVNGGGQIFETPYTHPKTGFKSDYFYTKALTTDVQGHTTGIVGAIVDVTERNLNQRKLLEATRMAEAANRAKSNFLANMSHEIRTPMNGVIGMLELALEMAVDLSQRDYLRLAKSSSQSLMTVINDILDISKIEANRVDIESIEFSLTDVIAHSLRPVEAMAKKKGLIFALELDPEVPDHVMGDPNRLRQVLLNLCDNAIKFTPKGQVIVRVTGSPTVDDTFELTVAVMDTGIGIAAEAQGSIFELFNQADTSITRKYGGSGLGLTISMKLAALMGGRITLASETGQGSTFTLRLRLSVPTSAVQVLALPAGASVLPPAPLLPNLPTPLQVMLVEDNLVNQILCCTILRKIGHTVVVANHGQEALDLLGSQHWDVILMDMQMPVMDGLEATRAIRALELPGQRTPIVAMTANAMETDRQLCLDTGMDDYLSKPFKFAELQAILEKAIGGN